MTTPTLTHRPLSTSASTRTAVILWIVFWGWLAASIPHALRETQDHDEQMYVTAGYLIGPQQHLYTDVTYLQMPYLPYLYHAAFTLTGTEHYLIVARMLTWLSWVIAIAAIYRCGRAVGLNATLACGALLLFMFDRVTYQTIREASNCLEPAACALLAVLLLLQCFERNKWNSVRFLGAGALASIAVGFKLYYLVLFAPLILVPLICLERTPREKIIQTLLILVGMLIGLLPCWPSFHRDPQAFIFLNYGFHRLTTAFHRGGSLGVDTSLLGGVKLILVQEWLQSPAWPCILAILILVFIQLKRRNVHWLQFLHGKTGYLLLLGLSNFALAAAVAVLMRPVWIHYTMFAAPFMILTLCAMLRLAELHQVPSLRTALLFAMLLPAGYCAARTLSRGRAVIQPSRWVTIAHEREARKLGQLLSKYPGEGKLACIQPLWAVDAHLPFYRQFDTGIFLYWIGDQLTPEQVAKYHAPVRKTLATSLLENDPPKAILAGFYPDYEKPFLDFANAHHYVKVASPISGSELYVRPD